MSFSKLTGSQTFALNRITALKRKLTLGRQDMRRAIEEQLEGELGLQNAALTQAVRDAAQMLNAQGRPTPKAALKRALGNQDHASLQVMLEGLKFTLERPVIWNPETRTVTIADFVFGGESVKGGTFAYDPTPYRGILYLDDPNPTGDWVRSKFDAGEDVMAEITKLVSGWLTEAKEQGAK